MKYVREFWVSSGHHMVRRRDDGRLSVTDELLLTYLARPEIVPPEDACVVERALYQQLKASPRAAVDAATIASIADADARENWQFLIAYRDLLIREETIEGAYLAIVRERMPVPPLFLNQLVHLILRNALEGCSDPYVLRAAELMFRPQRASVLEGALLLADQELVEEREREQHDKPLAAMFAGEPGSELDVLDEDNAWTYWSRSDAHSMALNFGGDPKSRTGLAVALTVFIHHLLGTKVTIEPLIDVKEVDFRWFVGLDQDATALGNRLWRGEEVPSDLTERLIGLFRLDFAEDEGKQRQSEGPVYLLMTMSPDKTVRLKPQNLVTGLPLAEDRPAA